MMYIYQFSFETPQYGIASAGAMILFVMTFVITLINLKMTGFFKKNKVLGGDKMRGKKDKKGFADCDSAGDTGDYPDTAGMEYRVFLLTEQRCRRFRNFL